MDRATVQRIAEELREWLRAHDVATIHALADGGYLKGPGYEQAIADATVKALAEAGWLKASTEPEPLQVVVVEMPRRRHAAIRDRAGKIIGSVEEDDE